MRKIIVLTKNFPFDVGEEFIENEDKYIGVSADVYYISTACNNHSSVTRNVLRPDRVFRINEIMGTINKVLFYTLLGFVELFSKSIREELKRSKGVRKKLSVLYFSAKTSRQCNRILSIPELNDILNEDNIVIYTYWFSDLPITAIKLLKKKKKEGKWKIVSRAHGYDLYDYRSSVGELPFRKYIMETVDHVYPCSKNGEKYLKRKFPEFLDKVSVSYLGTTDYGTQNILKDDSVFVIATCSSIIPLKRIDLLVHSLEITKIYGKKIRWICIGEGPLLEDIKKLSEKIKENVECIFKGRMKNSDIMDLYKNQQIDTFINLSTSEGLPVSIMEAMSFGIPCIATNVGGTSEIVIDGISGILLNDNPEVQEVSDAIIKMANGKIDRDKVRNVWLNNFSAEKNYKQFAKEIGMNE